MEQNSNLSLDPSVEKLLQKQEQMTRSLWGENFRLQQEVSLAYDQGHKKGYECGYNEAYQEAENDIQYKLRTSQPQNEIFILKKENENMLKEIKKLKKEKQILLQKNTKIEKQYKVLEKKYDELLVNKVNNELNLLKRNNTLDDDKTKLICENKKIKKTNTGLQQNIRSEQQKVKDIIDGKYTNKPFKYLKMLDYNYALSLRKLTNNKSKIKRKSNKRNVVL